MSEVEDRHRGVLEGFVYRSRRVAAHSLCADGADLLALAQGQFTVTVIGEQAEVVIDLPSEETVESLAARCRPFVLQNDSVHYAKVLNALGYFVRTDAKATTKVQEERARWESLRRDSSAQAGYEIQVKPHGANSYGLAVTDRELAYRWLYGDLVHADDIRGTEFDLTHRFRAGAALTAQIAVRVISALQLVSEARAAGLLTMAVSAFDMEVVARTHVRMPGRVMMAPVGTPANALQAAMDQVFGEAFI